jgi:hypothetical protein
VVVVTGNHFWLDGVAAAAIVAVAWPVVSTAMRHRYASSHSNATLLAPQPVADCVP